MEATARNVDVTSSAALFEDGLGQRFLLAGPSGESSSEALVFWPALAKTRSFEFALRERVARLSSFSYPAFPNLRGVDRGNGAESTLRLLSDAVAGRRLSEVIAQAEAAEVALDTNAALCVIRQLVAAVAALHERARDLSHGAIATERLLLTPEGRLVVLEHGTGAALQQLRYTGKRYWSELRVALPPSAGPVLFDQRVDMMQIGVVALGLLLGRPLRDSEVPTRVGDLVSSARAVSVRGGLEPLPSGLRGWLLRALQLDPLRSFSSALDARADLTLVLGDTDDFASLPSLEAFLDRLDQLTEPPVEVARAVAAEPEPPQRRDVVLADIDAALARPRSESAPARRPADETSNLLPFALRAEMPPVPAVETTDLPITDATPARLRIDDEPRAAAAGRRAPLALTPAPEAGATTIHAAQPVAPQVALDAPVLSGDAETAPAPTVVESVSAEPSDSLTFLNRIDAAFAVRSDVVESNEPSSERTSDEPAMEPEPTDGRTSLRRAVVSGLAPAVLAAFAGYTVASAAPFAPLRYLEPGTMVLATGPAGVEVFVDGRFRGLTPLSLPLTPGLHSVELHRTSAEPLTLPVTITAGMKVSQFVELPVGENYRLDDPSTLDTAADGASARLSGQLVDTGTVSIVSDAQLTVLEDDVVVGSSREALELPVGRHTLTMVDESSGINTVRSITVDAKKPAVIKVAMPTGLLAVNATPKAEVWVDGTRRGDTPASLSLRAGAHNVVLRHPELGERRQAVVVTAGDLLRVNVDLRTK